MDNGAGGRACRTLAMAGIYLGAGLTGAALVWFRMPLPWMSGALVFAAVTRLAGWPVYVLPASRPAGQILVASSVGLSFTPEAVTALQHLLLPLVTSAVITIALGCFLAVLLVRLARVDLVTACLSSIPIGPVESAHLAQLHGRSAGPVVFAQTLRIMILVLVIPPALMALDGRVADPTRALQEVEWNATGAILLLAIGLVGATAARGIRMPNPFFLGSIGGSALAAASDLPLSPYPYPALVLAQLVLGVWLGAVFDRDLIRRAGAFVPAAIVSAVVLIGLCIAVGLGLATWTGEAWQAMVLATAPGSVTEMALTAKVLQQGVAVVTAAHVVRVFIVLPLAPTLIRFAARLSRSPPS